MSSGVRVLGVSGAVFMCCQTFKVVSKAYQYFRTSPELKPCMQTQHDMCWGLLDHPITSPAVHPQGCP